MKTIYDFKIKYITLSNKKAEFVGFGSINQCFDEIKNISNEIISVSIKPKVKIKIKRHYSCGCVSFCEHKTMFGANLHAHLYYGFLKLFGYRSKIK